MVYEYRDCFELYGYLIGGLEYLFCVGISLNEFLFESFFYARGYSYFEVLSIWEPFVAWIGVLRAIGCFP